MNQADYRTRVLKSVQDGCIDDYEQYIRMIARGEMLTHWPTLFGYWLKQPCLLCSGTGSYSSCEEEYYIGSELHVSLVESFCMSCNGTGLCTWYQALAMRIYFVEELSAVSQYVKVMWCFVAMHDKSPTFTELVTRIIHGRGGKFTHLTQTKINKWIPYTVKRGLIYIDDIDKRIYTLRNGQTPTPKAVVTTRLLNTAGHILRGIEEGKIKGSKP